MSLALVPGVVHGLVGPSGCGKSALLLVLAGHRPAQMGSVIVIGGRSEVPAASVLLIPAKAPLLAHQTPLEALGMLLALDLRSRQPYSRMVEALRVTELPDRLLSRRCGEFAYVHRLSVWLAYHRLARQAVLLVDDLCDELLPEEAEDVAGVLRQIASPDATVMFTSRDTQAASACADRIFTFASHSLQPLRRPPSTGLER